MRLIDADELLTAFPIDDEPMVTKPSVRMTIRNMPTVKDVVEVVRCKDCAWSDWYTAVNGKQYCTCMDTGAHARMEMDYCSRGERRDGEQDVHSK